MNRKFYQESTIIGLNPLFCVRDILYTYTFILRLCFLTVQSQNSAFGLPPSFEWIDNYLSGGQSFTNPFADDIFDPLRHPGDQKSASSTETSSGTYPKTTTEKIILSYDIISYPLSKKGIRPDVCDKPAVSHKAGSIICLK